MFMSILRHVTNLIKINKNKLIGVRPSGCRDNIK